MIIIIFFNKFILKKYNNFVSHLFLFYDTLNKIMKNVFISHNTGCLTVIS